MTVWKRRRSRSMASTLSIRVLPLQVKKASEFIMADDNNKHSEQRTTWMRANEKALPKNF